eukprot:2431306-Amphidinium_carterae.1
MEMIARSSSHFSWKFPCLIYLKWLKPGSNGTLQMKECWGKYIGCNLVADVMSETAYCVAMPIETMPQNASILTKVTES